MHVFASPWAEVGYAEDGEEETQAGLGGNCS